MAADMRLQRATERFVLTLRPMGDFQRYSDRRFGNTDDGSLEADASWLEERSTLSLSTTVRDANTLTSELLSTGIIDLHTRRRDELATGAWSYSQTERRTFGVSVSFQSATYHGNDITPLQDYRYNTYALTERFLLSNRMTLAMDGTYGEYRVSNLADVTRSTGADLALSSNLSERNRLDLLFGINRRTDQFESSNGLIGSVTFARTTTVGSFSLSAGRSVLPSGFGVFSQSDQAQLGYTRALSARLTTSASLSAYRTSSAFQSQSLLQHTYEQSNVGFSWQASEEWSVSSTTQYSRSEGAYGIGNAKGWQFRVSSVWRPRQHSVSR